DRISVHVARHTLFPLERGELQQHTTRAHDKGQRMPTLRLHRGVRPHEPVRDRLDTKVKDRLEPRLATASALTGNESRSLGHERPGAHSECRATIAGVSTMSEVSGHNLRLQSQLPGQLVPPPDHPTQNEPRDTRPL